MRRAILALAVLTALVGSAKADDDGCIPLAHATPQMLDWLTGDWADSTGTSQAQQSWSAPINGILVGHEIIATAGATSFTFLRIKRTPSGLSLFVSINGGTPFEYAATELCSARVVFEGALKAYPSRIVYLNSLAQEAELRPPAKPGTERRFRPIIPEPLM